MVQGSFVVDQLPQQMCFPSKYSQFASLRCTLLSPKRLPALLQEAQILPWLAPIIQNPEILLVLIGPHSALSLRHLINPPLSA
jgi:hypothetical protein